MAHIWAAAWQNQQNDLFAQRTQISLGIHPVWSVFTVRSKGSKGLNLSSRGQRRLIRLGGCTGWSESLLGAHHFVGFVMHRLIIMYNKLPLAVRHLDGKRRIYMCADLNSSVNGIWFISTSQSTELSECYAPVICNNGPYGAREQRWYWLCKARVYA